MIVVLLALAALSACGGSKNNSETDVALTGTVTATATATAPPVTATPAPTVTPDSVDFLCQILHRCPSAATAPATGTAAPTAPPPPAPRTPTRTVPRTPTPTPPTPAQLQRALLTEVDLGGSWTLDDTDALPDEDFPAFYADFEDTSSDDFFSIELHDARNGAPDFLAVFMLVNRNVASFSPAAPLGYGIYGTRYRYDYSDSAGAWYGEVAAWQQGSVVIVMLIEGSDPRICLCGSAERQDAKVRAALR